MSLVVRNVTIWRRFARLDFSLRSEMRIRKTVKKPNFFTVVDKF
jgi:hypothetical protein